MCLTGFVIKKYISKVTNIYYVVNKKYYKIEQ